MGEAIFSTCVLAERRRIIHDRERDLGMGGGVMAWPWGGGGAALSV